MVSVALATYRSSEQDVQEPKLPSLQSRSMIAIHQSLLKSPLDCIKILSRHQSADYTGGSTVVRPGWYCVSVPSFRSSYIFGC